MSSLSNTKAQDGSSVERYTRTPKLPPRRCAGGLDVRAAGAETQPGYPQFCCQRSYRHDDGDDDDDDLDGDDDEYDDDHNEEEKGR